MNCPKLLRSEIPRKHMTPGYLAGLDAGNIGLAHGDRSGGLCSVDGDAENFMGGVCGESRRPASCPCKNEPAEPYQVRNVPRIAHALPQIQVFAGKSAAQ